MKLWYTLGVGYFNSVQLQSVALLHVRGKVLNVAVDASFFCALDTYI